MPARAEPVSRGRQTSAPAGAIRRRPTACPVSKAVRSRLHVDRQRSGVDASRPNRDGLRTDRHRGRRSLLVLQFRSDLLANVFAILFYTPILLCLPMLLVVGVLVCIPGGFIVVLGGLYYALTAFTGLLGLALSRRRRDGGSWVPPNTSSEKASRSARSSFGSRRAIAGRPAAFGLATDPAVGSAPNLELGRGSDAVKRVASRQRGHVPDKDGARAA